MITLVRKEKERKNQRIWRKDPHPDENNAAEADANVHEEEDNAGLEVSLDIVEDDPLGHVTELDEAEVPLLLRRNRLKYLGVVLNPGLEIRAGLARDIPGVVWGGLHLLNKDLLCHRGVGIGQLNKDNLHRIQKAQEGRGGFNPGDDRDRDVILQSEQT